MAAYHNNDWAECYDLWVRGFIGDRPAEDIAVFQRVLQELQSFHCGADTLTIVDIGTGSGRVPIGLLPVTDTTNATSIDIWGIEPSKAMLDRAIRFWTAATKDYDTKAKAHWVESDASSFVTDTEGMKGGADLMIFAAGSLCHIVKNQDIRRFLENVATVLKPEGRLVLSVLYTYIPKEDTDAAVEEVEKKESISIPSEDYPGILYVKHPTTLTLDRASNIVTESFKLDVVDAKGETLRTHELSWEARMFDKEFWEDEIKRAGLGVAELIAGDMQIWWICEKMPR